MSQTYGFSRSPTTEVTIQLDDAERGLLLSLARQVADFVAPPPADPHAYPLAAMVGIDATAEVPTDPALARLFPDAFIDDPDASTEFRRFTERSLRETKLANSRIVISALESNETEIGKDQIGAWLGFLNDARLTIGVRLEITDDAHAEMDSLAEDDPRLGLFHVYDWLTYLQDTLVRLLLPDTS